MKVIKMNEKRKLVMILLLSNILFISGSFIFGVNVGVNSVAPILQTTNSTIIVWQDNPIDFEAVCLAGYVNESVWNLGWYAHSINSKPVIPEYKDGISFISLISITVPYNETTHTNLSVRVYDGYSEDILTKYNFTFVGARGRFWNFTKGDYVIEYYYKPIIDVFSMSFETRDYFEVIVFGYGKFAYEDLVPSPFILLEVL